MTCWAVIQLPTWTCTSGAYQLCHSGKTTSSYQCDQRWPNSTHASKLPGTSECKGRRKYIPERVEHCLPQCPASEANKGHLKAECKNKANVSEHFFYLQGSITHQPEVIFFCCFMNVSFFFFFLS